MQLKSRSLLRVLLFFILPLLSLSSSGVGVSSQLKEDTNRGLNYPVPPENDRMLFYLQRSNNNNAIVYETNLLENGSINREDLVHIYWIRYSSDSTNAELTFIQRKYAYGLDSKEIEGKNGQFILNFVSYSKKKFYMIPERVGNKYQALVSINGKMAILERVFITLSGGTFWFPSIDNIEMRGRDPLTREVVIENFKP